MSAAEPPTTPPAVEPTPRAVEHAAPAVEHAAPVAGPEPGFTDTLALTFADAKAAVCGVFVLERGATGITGALLFADRELVASHARTDLAIAGAPEWQALGTDALSLEIAPNAWVVEMRGDGVELSVEFLPIVEPFIYDGDTAPATASGSQRSERLCHVAGSAKIAGDERTIDARGQRSHQWGPAPWARLDSWRAMTVWLDDDRSLAVWATRPTGTPEHAGEALAARFVESAPAHVVVVDDPRVSTTYAAEGLPLRAGLELWIGAEDPFALRAAGEASCAAALELGASRQLWSFMDWHMDGHDGAGALVLVTPAGAAPSP